jgi:hypothetical protein
MSEAIDLLRSIDASLKLLVVQLRVTQPKPVASERDLRSKFGDPILRFDPRDWHGPSYKGRKLSECPADLLDLVAETFEWFASQAETKGETTDTGKPVAEYKRLDAARARGWAKLIRDGRHTPSPVGGSNGQHAAPAGWAQDVAASDDGY